MPSLRHLLTRVRKKFLLEPAGYGRPLNKAVLDNEYASGAWAHFHQSSELPRQLLVAGLTAHLHARPTVLDLGCGSGRLAQLFQPFQPRRYLGVDLSSVGIAQARALQVPNCEFIEGNFETWRPQEKFEAILFSECIGYAQDPGALVAAFLPFLATDGHLVISHFRFGHWQAHWKRVAKHTVTLEETTVINSRGQTWDVRVLRPLAPTS